MGTSKKKNKKTYKMRKTGDEESLRGIMKKYEKKF